MKKDFDNLVLNYLSIYNESSRYMGPNDEYQPELSDIYDHEDRIADMKKAAADDEAADNAPETCPTCESDIYDGECVNCGHSMKDEDNESQYNHEDNESEYCEHPNLYEFDDCYLNEDGDEVWYRVFRCPDCDDTWTE